MTTQQCIHCNRLTGIGPDAFRRSMSVLAEIGDTEHRHAQMDYLMCTVLTSLGYGDGVNIFTSTERWYA